MNAGSQTIAALEGLWACIRDRHPDVPEVLFITGDGTGKAGSKVDALGWFGAGKWHAVDGKGRLAELMVTGATLSRGAEAVLGTTLHEAAHALAEVRGIQDTSRQGRYHNKRFVCLAQEVGLCPQEEKAHGTYGFAYVTLPEHTVEAYAEELAALRSAIRYHYAGGDAGEDEEEGEEDEKPAARPRYECGCPRVIRMSAATYEEGGIACRICDEDFAPVVD